MIQQFQTKNNRIENEVQKLYDKLREQYVTFCADFNSLSLEERENCIWQSKCKENYDGVVKEMVISVEKEIESMLASKYLTWENIKLIIVHEKTRSFDFFKNFQKLLLLAQESTHDLRVNQPERDNLSNTEYDEDYDELKERLAMIQYVRTNPSDYERRKPHFKLSSSKSSPKERENIKPSEYVPSVNLEELDNLEGIEFNEQLELFQLIEPICIPIIENFYTAIICKLILNGGIDLGLKRAFCFHCKELHYNVDLDFTKISVEPEVVCEEIGQRLHFL